MWITFPAGSCNRRPRSLCTQPGERPKRLSTNGGRSALEDLGDLRIGQVEVIPQHHDRPLSPPERHQRPVQVRPSDYRGVA